MIAIECLLAPSPVFLGDDPVAYHIIGRCEDRTLDWPEAFGILPVAHREEILRQALRTYREVLRDPEFGQLFTGGHEPDHFDHLFATIQTLNARNALDTFGVEHWHTVVFDECHRLAADSFDRIATAIPAVREGLDRARQSATSVAENVGLGRDYTLFALIDGNSFIYLAADRAAANLAIVRTSINRNLALFT